MNEKINEGAAGRDEGADTSSGIATRHVLATPLPPSSRSRQMDANRPVQATSGFDALRRQQAEAEIRRARQADIDSAATTNMSVAGTHAIHAITASQVIGVVTPLGIASAILTALEVDGMCAPIANASHVVALDPEDQIDPSSSMVPR